MTWMCLAKLFCRNKHSVCKQNCSALSHKASGLQTTRQLGQGSKVKGSKPFGVYFLAEPLAAFQAELLETVHTKAFCQQPTDSWLRWDPVTKVLSFAFFLHVLALKIYKNTKSIIQTTYVKEVINSTWVLYKISLDGLFF